MNFFHRLHDKREKLFIVECLGFDVCLPFTFFPVYVYFENNVRPLGCFSPFSTHSVNHSTVCIHLTGDISVLKGTFSRKKLLRLLL
jgi:hypothetical protein